MAKRDLSGVGLGLLNRMAQSSLMQRAGFRKVVERALYSGSRSGFRLAGNAARQFKAAGRLMQPQRLASASTPPLFDLTPTDEQQMMRDAVQAFALAELRSVASAADEALAAPPEVLAAADDLGIRLLSLPESLGGAGHLRSTITQTLVAESMAQGDLSLAVACLAPIAVLTALVEWGDAEQQDTYLPAFAGDHSPVAALAILEPEVAFDPFRPHTAARRQGESYVLNGEKSLVARAAEAELFVIAADLEGEGGRLFIVEGGSAGLQVHAEPAMGLRSASTARVQMQNVLVPASALLGSVTDYQACVRRARLAWCALSCGTARAVQSFVTPYVNERQAFGEPISHRQSVAFAVANMAIEHEGMWLATLRAASRIERGEDAAREVALARRLCMDKGVQVGSDGVQLLGGHGFTKEYPVERWYRDLRAVGVMEGVVLV